MLISKLAVLFFQHLLRNLSKLGEFRVFVNQSGISVDRGSTNPTIGYRKTPHGLLVVTRFRESEVRKKPIRP